MCWAKCLGKVGQGSKTLDWVWRGLSQPGFLQGLSLFQQMLVWVVCKLADLLNVGRTQAKPGAVCSFHFEVFGKVTKA